MNKNRTADVFSRITSFFITHPWLKLISLLLAVIVWFYVKGEKI